MQGPPELLTLYYSILIRSCLREAVVFKLSKRQIVVTQRSITLEPSVIAKDTEVFCWLCDFFFFSASPQPGLDPARKKPVECHC